MVLPLAYPGEGWIGCKGIGVFIHSGGPGDPYIWVGDVGCDPPHGVDPGGGGPPPDGETSHGEIPLVPIRRDLELTFVGIGHVGSGS